jgi:pyruvate carboxylase
VFKDYAAHRSHYGDVSLLPTPAFFYGLREREEIAVEIDRGKTLIVSQQGMSGPDEEGHVKVAFELNGQPRTARIAKAGMAALKRHPRAEEGNPQHVGAPMPGTVVTVAVQPGQKVAKGDPLVSIEAMKMESMLAAECDGVVAAIHVKPGEVVNAKDLLLEYA